MPTSSRENHGKPTAKTNSAPSVRVISHGVGKCLRSRQRGRRRQRCRAIARLMEFVCFLLPPSKPEVLPPPSMREGNVWDDAHRPAKIS